MNSKDANKRAKKRDLSPDEFKALSEKEIVLKIKRNNKMKTGIQFIAEEIKSMNKHTEQLLGIENADFYILNIHEHKSIAVHFSNDIQYEGITFYKTNLGWELEPTKIGKGFITSCEGKYDFSKDFKLAIENADQTKY